MTTPKIVRMDRSGLAGKGLEDWGSIDPGLLVSGTPRERGYMVLDDRAHGVSAGLWDCTAFTGKMRPRPNNEFMVLLEGSVTIIEPQGRETVIAAGESFVLPKGLVCQWHQADRVRKFFVIFEDASGARGADSASLRVVKLDLEAKLDPAGGPDPKLVVSGDPRWHDKPFWEDPTGQWTVGLWSTTPYERRAITFPRHELMHLIAGSVALTDGMGGAETFRAGETVFVPKGATVGWRSTEPVRKIYCIFHPSAAAARSAAAE